jgi:molybdopterin molybdotransferase
VGTVLVKLQGFQKLTLTDQALSAWLNMLQIDKPKEETVSLSQALNRVLAEDLVASEDLPRFDKSAMDGYAVKAADIVGASQKKPAALQVTEAAEVNAKQVHQIWTGNPIPKGADTVIMLENTKKCDSTLDVWSQVPLGSNIIRHGEDTKKGSVPVKAQTRLNPYHLGLAAALGYTQLKVAKQPQIAVIATGNEIAEVGVQRTENQIYDSNKTMITAMCHEMGAQTIDFGIVKDDIKEIAQKIQAALKTSDAVITTGGTSVGGMDLVPDAVNKLGKPGVVAHGMALRPAMPTGLGILEGKPVLILSGNPVAAVIGFEVFGRPLISRMLGYSKSETRPVVQAVLAKKISSALGRKTYVRVKVTAKNGKFVAEPVSAKGSGSISTMTQSNGYVVVPENLEGIVEGETVTVQMFAPVEEA